MCLWAGWPSRVTDLSHSSELLFKYVCVPWVIWGGLFYLLIIYLLISCKKDILCGQFFMFNTSQFRNATKMLLSPVFYCKILLKSFEIFMGVCFACSSLWYSLPVQQRYGIYHIILTVLVSYCLCSWSHSPFLSTDLWPLFLQLFTDFQVFWFYPQKLQRVLNGSLEGCHILQNGGQVFYNSLMSCNCAPWPLEATVPTSLPLSSFQSSTILAENLVPI